MKKRSIVKMLASVMVVVLVGSIELKADFVPENEIRQTQHSSDPSVGDAILHIYTDQDTGEQTASAAIGAAGSTFELWIDVEDEAPLLADTKFVQGKLPSVVFSIVTPDPWRSIVADEVLGRPVERQLYRTRVDYGYDVAVTASLPSSDPADPDSLTKVMVLHEGDNADPETFQMNETRYSIGDNEVLMNGGVFSSSGPNLVGFSPSSKMVGEEYITVKSYPNPPAVPLPLGVGKASIQIWPMMTGRFMQEEDGLQVPFVNGQVFNDKVRTVYVHYQDIYPGSMAYVQIYKNSTSGGYLESSVLEVTGLKTSFVDANGNPLIDEEGNLVAQNEPRSTGDGGLKISNSFLQPYFLKWGSGSYTLQIINDALPFPVVKEGLNGSGKITFSVNRAVKINSQIGTVQ